MSTSLRKRGIRTFYCCSVSVSGIACSLSIERSDTGRVRRRKQSQKAPSTIIATKFAGDADSPGARAVMRRPLCAYPQEAQYKGSGDTNEAASFVCAKGGK